ncbi:putative peptidoglycan binding domain protein, partial [Vibrio parahaemolyticus V-223/04]|jgi:small nuclear ribonucleoprotein D2
MAET